MRTQITEHAAFSIPEWLTDAAARVCSPVTLAERGYEPQWVNTTS